MPNSTYLAKFSDELSQNFLLAHRLCASHWKQCYYRGKLFFSTSHYLATNAGSPNGRNVQPRWDRFHSWPRSNQRQSKRVVTISNLCTVIACTSFRYFNSMSVLVATFAGGYFVTFLCIQGAQRTFSVWRFLVNKKVTDSNEHMVGAPEKDNIELQLRLVCKWSENFVPVKHHHLHNKVWDVLFYDRFRAHLTLIVLNFFHRITIPSWRSLPISVLVCSPQTLSSCVLLNTSPP